MSDEQDKAGSAEEKNAITTPHYKSTTKLEEVDGEERTVTAVISTGSVDRDEEVLVPKGAVIDNYDKNKVVLWSHDRLSPPIGKALWVKKGRDKITAKVKFAVTERAEEIWQLFKGGFLKAFSVGFMPLEYREPSPDDVKKTPEYAAARRLYTKWELLEFSAVAVPANPEALALAVKQHKVKIDKIDEFELPIITKSLSLSPVVELAKHSIIKPVMNLDSFEEPDPGKIMEERIKLKKGIVY